MSEVLVQRANTEFAPNYDFINTREITVKDYFGTMFVQFAKYRANQRIPRLDGLNETQRKILWTAMSKNYTKKNKLIQVMADVNLVSNYHHGQDSLATALNNLIAPYKNNMLVLRPDGSFGSRTVRKAAAYRYTETRVFGYLKKLFPTEDIVAMKAYRTIDGLPAEPLTLLPIIPMGIINGQSQAAVGFSTNLLPRDPLIIIDLLLNILSGQAKTIPGSIPPKYPFFTGSTKLVDKNKWEMSGRVSKYTKGKKEIIVIEEVPPSWSKTLLIQKLEKLVETGVIESYSEACKGNSFYSEIIAPNLFKLSEDAIISKLKLSETEVERFVYIASEEGLDEDGNSIPGTSKDKFEIQCENIAQYLNYFIKKRLAVYEGRKRFRQAKQMWEIKKINATINYINEVNAGRIEIRNKEEEEVVAQLATYSENYMFIPMTERFVWDEVEALMTKPNYNYLFDFKTRNFTPKALNRLNENYNKLYQEYTDIQLETAAGMWYKDLLEFKEEYLKFQKEYEASVAKLNK